MDCQSDMVEAISGPISAVVTACERVTQTVATLHQLEACRPAPDEILVHVDGNQTTCAKAVRGAFPHLTVIMSDTSVGPGGGRNKLIAAARNELIASFDDDSYPIDTDYFSRARLLAEAFPDAALFAASIFHRNEALTVDENVDFTHCELRGRWSCFPALGISSCWRVRAARHGLWHGRGGSGASAPRPRSDVASLFVAARLPRYGPQPSQLGPNHVRHHRKYCAARLAALSG